MNWKNIRLIFRREMRDQLRDRRTLFMIAVLPLLFYPLLGVSFFQIAQFLRDAPSRYLVIGYEAGSTDMPSLIDKQQDRFATELFENPQEAKKAILVFRDIKSLIFIKKGKWPKDGRLTKVQQNELERELTQLKKLLDCNYVIFFQPNFNSKLQQHIEEYKLHVAQQGDTEIPLEQGPKPLVLYDTSTDQNRLAHSRGDSVLERWTENVNNYVRVEANIPAVPPVGITKTPVVYGKDRINASLWSKVLPFVLMIWAVTGAFYPAVDLCAGEKERGTLETLLSSPARRSEIVMGKLFTVMLFSIATAVLNLASMCLTGAVVIKQLGDMAVQADVGPPPFTAILWMSAILLPVAALFSAVCLSLAAFARSTKEGQYYLMPVIVVTMPLILLPMAPNIELNLGFSLIPVSGMVLLMRSMMEGTYHELWPYTFPVAAVTLACCWLSVRWAIEQFSREDVLFREGERWDLTTWVKHLLRDHEDTPTVALAVLCGVLILVVQFFMRGAITTGNIHQISYEKLFTFQAIFMVVTVLMPALFMTLLLTRKPRKTLQLSAPSWLSLPAAGLMALAFLPIVIAIQSGVMTMVGPSEAALKEINVLDKLFGAAPMWAVILVIALLPALCEEFAFRGFILSGFRHRGHDWRAIIFTSLFFAITHTILFQQFNAFLLGMLLGYLAVKSRSIWPPVIYHFVHNATVQLSAKIHIRDNTSLLEFISNNDNYAGAAIFFGTLLGVVLLFWFHVRQPRGRSRQPDSFDPSAPATAAN
ncbi:MAG: ABC transporter permease subunit/CPBP intramembrane protease [Pirellulales bacterium]